jgi:DNA invertase Pin-like site-specific DNA recombinase
MKKIGYARVSTKDQNLEMQLEAIKHAGCDKIYMEKKSGRKIEDRPVLKKLLKQSTSGDTLIVWKIDRLGRSAKDLLEVLDLVRRKCMIIISLQEGINTSTMIGEFFFMMAGVFAEMEISGRSERTKEGIRIAKLKGKKLGRPRGISISHDKLAMIIELKRNGYTIKEISLKTGVPISSVYRYIKLNK